MLRTVINVKVEREVRNQAKKLARELGVPLSTIINAQLRQFVREKTIRLEAAPRMSAKLETLLEPVEKDRKTGRNFSPPFVSGEEMDQWLDL